MESAGNPNQGGDKPSTPSPTRPVSASGNPNPQITNNPNLMISSPPSASYPPPTGGGGSVPAHLTSPFEFYYPQCDRPLRSTMPKGRHLMEDHILYHIDDRLPGEVQPQLKGIHACYYVPDLHTGPVFGRQIAVNKPFICYPFGHQFELIRVFRINTHLALVLHGLAQRVTDMIFFAEDVHLLASASASGQVYIWKITEGEDEDGKLQITSQIVIAIQIVGEGESFYPRVCWHCHKQEILIVGIGGRVLKIDTTKVEKGEYDTTIVGKGEICSVRKPLSCPVDGLVEGVQLVGTHDGEVTDLSMSQGITTFLVSASIDGTIKVWEDHKSIPIAVLRPHDGQPVNSVTFLAAPNNPDHIILITGGPLNREVKIWPSASEKGWLVPSDAESWHCTQTLELKSSPETQVGEAFFNQVVAFSQAGLLLLANAKKNAIYAVHLEYGLNPAATRMDYIAEFTVTMPILSFTGKIGLLNGEQKVLLYCVEKQDIQQYALDLSHCLPHALDDAVFERSEYSPSLDVNIEEFSYIMEKAAKFNADALWVRLQEESAKQEKLLCDLTQQMTNMMSNLPRLVADVVKKEVSAICQTAVEAVTPIIENAVFSAISEARWI